MVVTVVGKMMIMIAMTSVMVHMDKIGDNDVGGVIDDYDHDEVTIVWLKKP